MAVSECCLIKLLPYILFDKIYLYLCIAQGTGTVPIVSAHFRSLLYRNGWTDRAGFLLGGLFRPMLHQSCPRVGLTHGLGLPTGWAYPRVGLGQARTYKMDPWTTLCYIVLQGNWVNPKNIGKPTSLYGPLFQFLTNLAAVRRSTQRAVN